MPLWYELSFCTSVYEIEVALFSAEWSTAFEKKVALYSAE